VSRVDVGFTSEDDAGVDRLTVLRSVCCDLGPCGYLCTLPDRHSGEHHADLDGRALATWGPA
jgi:hypothetical protein